jgi:hypothetical protein
MKTEGQPQGQGNNTKSHDKLAIITILYEGLGGVVGWRVVSGLDGGMGWWYGIVVWMMGGRDRG